MNTQRDPLLSCALTVAGHGWPVFPLRPGAKQPALHGYDRCPRTGVCADRHVGWEQRATTDQDRIHTAWSAGQDFNVGLATGPAGLLVIDLDTAKPGDHPPAEWDQPGVRDGADVLAVLAADAGQPVPAGTFTVATPSGGLHLYYLAPDGTRYRNTAGTALGWKIDTRAWGGYVVAPGSTVDGRAYRVIDPTPPIPLPAWLADLLTPTPLPAAPVRPITTGSRRDRYLSAAIAAEQQRVHTATGGGRNAALYAAALALGQLVAGGALTDDDVLTTLLEAAARHIALGAYSQRQAEQTIRSGLRAGTNRPRQVA